MGAPVRDGLSGLPEARARPSDRYCQVQPGWAWQVACVLSAVQGVTLPEQTLDVACHEQPRCRRQVLSLFSWVHCVRVPVHDVAVVDHVQPGVVQAAWVGALQEGVPVHDDALNVQPSFWQSL